jgi:hypothetical protein
MKSQKYNVKSSTLHRLTRSSLLIGMLSIPCLFASGVSAQNNLATGKAVTATSTVDVYGAANSNDGNQGSYWESQNNAFPQSLTMDLGTTANVNRVVLKLPNNWGSRTQTLSVLGSVNGSTYTTLASANGYLFDPNSNNTVNITFTGTDTRYVRVTFTGNTSWPAGQVSEFEVYGAAGDPEARDAFTPIKATSYNTMSGIQTEATSDTGGGANVGWIDNGDWLLFEDVDFGSGANSVNARVASNHAGGTIDFRLGSVSGELIGSVDVGYTGGWQSWVTETDSVSVEGVHDLYLVFTGTASGGLFNLNWVQFDSVDGPALPAVPQNLSVTSTTTSTVSLSWSSVSGAEGYEVLRNGNLVTSTGSTSYTDTGLAEGTSYSYTVRAYNQAGSSAPSGAVPATTEGSGGNPDPEGSNVAEGQPVTASSTLSFLATGNAVDGNPTSYWESHANAFPQTLTVDLGSTHYISQVVLKLPDSQAWATRTQTLSVQGSADGSSFTTLKASAGYVFNPSNANTVTISFPETTARYVRLAITANTGWSAAQVSEFEVYGYPDPVPPATPQNLRVSGVSDTSVFLAWDSASLAAEYEVLRGGNVVATVTSTSYEDAGLTPLTSYSYTVRALNQFGTSPASNSISVTTDEEGSGDPGHPEPNGDHGANMPYDRYDTEDANYGGGAVLKTAPTFNQMLTASEASGQSYIALPSNGSFAEWTVRSGEGGAGVTMRFTMPDSSNGMGLNGALDVYVNGTKARTQPLTSYYNYQYFAVGGGHPSDTPSGGNPLFRFDEVHWKLDTALQPGDVIRIVKANGDSLEYGVDFLEIESVPNPISRPANSVSVTDFGAIANDGQDDLTAFNAAVTAAVANGQSLYIPPGTFHLNSMWVIGSVANKIDDITIMGAGIWHTNIQFTNPNVAGGGISFRVAGQLDFSHVYMNSMLRSRYHEGAIYKGFMDNFGVNSKVHNVWVEHFECGFWVGDYAHTPAIIADGLVIEHSRIRNNLADGVNFAQGTSNSTVRNSSIRNNGDDGLAVWTSNVNGAPAGVNNTFTHNTIEFNWRAAGIAFFGGSGHQATYNLIVDGVGSSGFRMNTVFPGYHFQNNTGIVFSDSTIIRSGTSLDTWGGERGAIDLEASSDPIRNVTISNIDIYDTQRSAIQMGYGGGFQNVVFNNIVIDGTGLDGVTTSRFSGPHPGAAIYSYTNNGTATFNNLTTRNVAHPNTNFIQNGFNLIIQ